MNHQAMCDAGDHGKGKLQVGETCACSQRCGKGRWWKPACSSCCCAVVNAEWGSRGCGMGKLQNVKGCTKGASRRSGGAWSGREGREGGEGVMRVRSSNARNDESPSSAIADSRRGEGRGRASCLFWSLSVFGKSGKLLFATVAFTETAALLWRKSPEPIGPHANPAHNGLALPVRGACCRRRRCCCCCCCAGAPESRWECARRGRGPGRPGAPSRL